LSIHCILHFNVVSLIAATKHTVHLAGALELNRTNLENAQNRQL